MERSPLLSAMVQALDPGIVVRDVAGRFHFHPAFRNAGQLRTALEGLRGGKYGALAEAEMDRLLDFYEEVFDHRAFTGRSGAFYKYEGLGCICWHMVSKLLVAVDEVRGR